MLAEAMLNNIPAIVTSTGGSPEMIANAGIVLELPAECHEPPYNRLPQGDLLQPLVDAIIKLYDDEPYYQKMVARAKAVGQRLHSMERNTDRLLETLQPLLQQQAGDLDVQATLSALHQHEIDLPKLEDNKPEQVRVGKTGHKTDA